MTEQRLHMNEELARAILSLFQEGCPYKIEKLVFVVITAGDSEDEVREYVWGFNDCPDHDIEPVSETDALDIMAATLMGAAMERMQVVPIIPIVDPDHPRFHASEN